MKRIKHTHVHKNEQKTEEEEEEEPAFLTAGDAVTERSRGSMIAQDDIRRRASGRRNEE